MPNPALFNRVDHLLNAQLQGVLATQLQNQPYTSLMAFVHTPDLRSLVFATYRDTQKHANLMRNADVAFLVDNRSNTAIDYEEAIAITAIGHAEVIADEDHDALHRLYALKHPQLEAFIASPACALLRVRVRCYRVVSRFQAVELLNIADADCA